MLVMDGKVGGGMAGKRQVLEGQEGGERGAGAGMCCVPKIVRKKLTISQNQYLVFNLVKGEASQSSTWFD